MKKIFMAVILSLGFSFAAHAFEGEEAFLFGEQMQQQEVNYSSAEAEPVDMEVNASSRYCCIRSHGGGYCDMGEYKRLSAPCKCYVGNNVSYGHVCR